MIRSARWRRRFCASIYRQRRLLTDRARTVGVLVVLVTAIIDAVTADRECCRLLVTNDAGVIRVSGMRRDKSESERGDAAREKSGAEGET